MMFDDNDNMKESAENAFNAYLAPRDSAENEHNYLTNELGFTNPIIISALDSFEKRAKAIIDSIDDATDKPVGRHAETFESLSWYMQTSDAYDSESDYISSVIPNVNDMLDVFEAFIK